MRVRAHPNPPPPLLQSCSRKHRGESLATGAGSYILLHLGTKESPMEAAVPVMGLSCQ